MQWSSDSATEMAPELFGIITAGDNFGVVGSSEQTVSTTAIGAASVFAGDLNLMSASRNDDKIACYENKSNETGSDLPTIVELEQNYPNPFNPSTTIAYGVPETGEVILKVFDILGRKVATLLASERKSVGRYTVNFDASCLVRIIPVRASSRKFVAFQKTDTY